MTSYGIRGNTWKWVQSFLHNRTQQVLLDGEMFNQLPVVSEVPQGSVLGPLLFLIFINDLPAAVNSKTRLFADDCILYRNINAASDCQILQQDLVELENWEKTWGMEFHPGKCNSMSITRSRTPIHQRYTLKGHILEDVKTAKYLGVTLSNNLTWNAHIDNISSKANKLLGFLRRNLKVRNTTVKENAYKAIVRSNMEYCSTVWAPHTKKNKAKLENVQRRAARFTTGRYHNTSSVSSMLDDLNWENLEQRRMRARIIMFYKITHYAVAIDPQQYLIPQTRTTRSAHPYQYQSFSPTTDYYKYSFFPQTVCIWNSLPAEIVESGQTLDQFKTLIQSYKF